MIIINTEHFTLETIMGLIADGLRDLPISHGVMLCKKYNDRDGKPCTYGIATYEKPDDGLGSFKTYGFELFELMEDEDCRKELKGIFAFLSAFNSLNDIKAE